MNWKIFNSLELAYKPNSPNLFGIDDALLGGALALGGSVVSGLFGSSSQKSANSANLQAVRETNEANLKLYREQYADQYKLWQENNAYNDPSSQMQRLRNAGLNPALLMLNGGAGSASAASVPSAAPMQAGHVDPVPPAFNASDVAATLAAISQSGKSIEEANNLNISGQFLRQQNRAEIQQKLANCVKLLASSDLDDSQRAYVLAQKKQLELDYRLNSEVYDAKKQGFELQNELQQANIEVARQQTAKLASEKAYNEVITTLESMRIPYEDKAIRAAIDKTISEVRLNNILSDHEIEKIYKTMLEAEGVRMSNEILRETKGSVVQKSKEDVKKTQAETKRAEAEADKAEVEATDVKVGPWSVGSEHRDRKRAKYKNR